MLIALLGLALAAAPDAGAPLAPFEWNVPRIDRLVEVGDKLEAKGLPLKVYLVHTPLSLPEIYRHYYERFIKEGFYVDHRQKPLPGLTLARLTAFDERRLWSYTVIFYPESDNSTTLTLGAADLHPRQKGAAPAAGPGLPVLPGAKRVLTSNVEFGRSVSFETPDAPEQVLSYYQATMPTLGWKERDRGTFVRNGRRVRLMIRPAEKDLQVVLVEDADLDLPGPKEVEAR